MQNINSGMIKPKYTQLISSCPAPLSSSFPVSSHHPIFLSSTFSICFLFILLISMPCKLPLPSGSPTHHNSFSESAKNFLKFPTQSSIQNAVPFRRHCVLTAFPWSGLVWNVSRQLSIESIIEFNKG